jgi:hypothetical protein
MSRTPGAQVEGGSRVPRTPLRSRVRPEGLMSTGCAHGDWSERDAMTLVLMSRVRAESWSDVKGWMSGMILKWSNVNGVRCGFRRLGLGCLTPLISRGRPETVMSRGVSDVKGMMSRVLLSMWTSTCISRAWALHHRRQYTSTVCLRRVMMGVRHLQEQRTVGCRHFQGY